MKHKHFNLFYWNDSHTEEDKNLRKKHLKELKEDLENKVNFENIEINFHEEKGFSNGNVFVSDVGDSYESFRAAKKYILSSNSNYLPISMMAHSKSEFFMIENILKDHYGGDVKLGYGLFNFGRRLGLAEFKVKQNNRN